MKKLLMISMIALFSITANAQFQDCRTKICFQAYNSGTYTLLIINKMNTATSYTITWPDGVRTTSIEVSAYGSAYEYYTHSWVSGIISVMPNTPGAATCAYAPVSVRCFFQFFTNRCF